MTEVYENKTNGHHVGSHEDPELYGEKRRSIDVNSLNNEIIDGEVVNISSTYWGVLGTWSKKLESLGFEARGIQRVTAAERSPQSFWGLCLIWASAGLTIGTFTTGTLGPGLFKLTLAETIWITWGAGALGSACSAYMAIFGKRNGLRALVNSRYVFGFYGAMVMSALNILTEVVFGVLACIQGGQTLNSISTGQLPTSWGIVIVAVISFLIATAGFKYVHYYERFAFIPPMIVFISLYSVGSKWFSHGPFPATADDPADLGRTHSGDLLSFIAIIFGSSSGWVPVSADYYIYFPESTKSWKIFVVNFLGVWIIPAFSITCGAGFGTAIWTNTEWAAVYNDNPTSPALIEVAFRPLGDVRYFFLFILAWSMISNNVFNLYSISISMQLFGNFTLHIPRYLYSLLAIIVMIVLSIVGQNSLYDVLSDLVAIIGYWTIIYFVIFVEEHVIFRQSHFKAFGGLGWDLTAWDDRHRLPLGLAGGLAFCFGIAGAVVGMAEAWYIGPIGAMIGDYGADLGIELGFLFAGITYPPLRYIELKFFPGR